MIDFDDLRTLRDYLEMTQEKMAGALGISERYYRMMESGEREMSTKVAQNLYQYLKAYHSDLVTITQIVDCISKVE